MVSKARILVSILVIVIIGILVVPPQDNSNEPITTVYESDFVSSDKLVTLNLTVYCPLLSNGYEK